MRTSPWLATVLGVCSTIAGPDSRRRDHRPGGSCANLQRGGLLDRRHTQHRQVRSHAGCPRQVRGRERSTPLRAVSRLSERHDASIPGSGCGGGRTPHAESKLPRPRRKFRPELACALGLVPDGPQKTGGVQVGRDAAAAVMKRAVLDDTVSLPEYRPRGIPGVYILTDPPALSRSAQPAAMMKKECGRSDRCF